MQKENGFTLLETMIVVCIIGAVIMCVPSINAWLRHQGVGLAADQLRTDLQLARMTAINCKQNCALVFDAPGPNQYINSLSRRYASLSGFRGGVHFMNPGPDKKAMAAQIEFNRRGMSTSVVPMEVFLADQDRRSVFRVRVLAPGGISVDRWSGEAWK